MAEVNKEKLNEEVSDQSKKSEPSDKKSKSKTKPKSAPKPKKKLKPYIHIDTFLQTAEPFYGLTKMQSAGFKSLMAGRHYQRDEQVFVDELKNYLNIK